MSQEITLEKENIRDVEEENNSKQIENIEPIDHNIRLVKNLK
jgi:hypothetical protein